MYIARPVATFTMCAKDKSYNSFIRCLHGLQLSDILCDVSSWQKGDLFSVHVSALNKNDPWKVSSQPYDKFYFFSPFGHDNGSATLITLLPRENKKNIYISNVTM